MSRKKLDADQFAPHIIPFLLVTLSERVAAAGVAPERLFAGLGFDLPALRNGLLVSRRQAWRVIRRALQLTGRGDLGLAVGRDQNLASFGLLGQAFVTAATVGEALRLGVRHYPAGGALVDVEMRTCGHDLELALYPRLRDARVVMFLIEELLLSVLELFRRELGMPFALQDLQLRYPPPAHAALYRPAFGCTPRFDAGHNRCRIAARWLREPMPGHDAARARQVEAELEAVARRTLVDSVAAVENMLARPGQHDLSLAQLARAMDLSPRTLRRRLREEGTSYRAIHNRVRAGQARRLLAKQGLSVAEAARRLGFADAHSFRRACKRWCNLSPDQLRSP